MTGQEIAVFVDHLRESLLKYHLDGVPVEAKVEYDTKPVMGVDGIVIDATITGETITITTGSRAEQAE